MSKGMHAARMAAATWQHKGHSRPPALMPSPPPPLPHTHHRTSAGNNLELRSNPPTFVYSDAPLTTSDGVAVAQPAPGAAGYSLMLSDQQVCPLPHGRARGPAPGAALLGAVTLRACRRALPGRHAPRTLASLAPRAPRSNTCRPLQVLMMPNFRDFPSDAITVEFWMWSVDSCRKGARARPHCLGPCRRQLGACCPASWAELHACGQGRAALAPGMTASCRRRRALLLRARRVREAGQRLPHLQLQQVRCCWAGGADGAQQGLGRAIGCAARVDAAGLRWAAGAAGVVPAALAGQLQRWGCLQPHGLQPRLPPLPADPDAPSAPTPAAAPAPGA
jgi:hypothetical protein